MEAADLLSRLFCGLIGSAAAERDTFNDFVETKETIERAVGVQRMRQRNYRVDCGGGRSYRPTAAQAAGVSSASR